MRIIRDVVGTPNGGGVLLVAWANDNALFKPQYSSSREEEKEDMEASLRKIAKEKKTKMMRMWRKHIVTKF